MELQGFGYVSTRYVGARILDLHDGYRGDVFLSFRVHVVTLPLKESSAFSQSAVNYNAGAETVVSNIVMAAAVLITLLFLRPLSYYTPNLVLAVIIISAVIGLIDYKAVYELWRVDKLDFLACFSSFFSVSSSFQFHLDLPLL